MKPVSLSPKNTLFRNEHVDVYSVTADFAGFTREYFVVGRGVRVGVILLKGDSVLLVKQYRYLINDMSWELPSGGVEDGETLEEAAVRECLEETGVRCKSLTPVFDFVLNVDVMDCPAYIFSCGEFEQVGDFDRREISEVKWVPYEKCLDMVFSKEIKDVYTILGLMLSRGKRSG